MLTTTPRPAKRFAQANRAHRALFGGSLERSNELTLSQSGFEDVALDIAGIKTDDASAACQYGRPRSQALACSYTPSDRARTTVRAF
jgi:hypothetical protein